MIKKRFFFQTVTSYHRVLTSFFKNVYLKSHACLYPSRYNSVVARYKTIFYHLVALHVRTIKRYLIEQLSINTRRNRDIRELIFTRVPIVLDTRRQVKTVQIRRWQSVDRSTCFVKRDVNHFYLFFCKRPLLIKVNWKINKYYKNNQTVKPHK